MPAMQYRRMGATGLELSAVSLGSWATIGERLDDRGSLELLDTAYELGINFFDNAETYADGRSEEAMGRALAQLDWPRETYVVSGKVFWGVHRRRPNSWGLSRKHVVEGCHAALRRLQLDHLDLYLCHRPDPGTPLLETVRAMSDLVTQGKVLYWGTSEWPASAVLEAHALAQAHGFVPPAVEQLQYNLLVRDRVEVEFAELPRQIGLGITAWAPLAYGLLAGRYDAGEAPGGRLEEPEYAWLRETALGPDEDLALARIRSVNEFAGDLGVAPSQLALAWVLRNPAVSSAITGASRVEHVRENVEALAIADDFDEAVLAEIEARLGRPPSAADTARSGEERA